MRFKWACIRGVANISKVTQVCACMLCKQKKPFSKWKKKKRNSSYRWVSNRKLCSKKMIYEGSFKFFELTIRSRMWRLLLAERFQIKWKLHLFKLLTTPRILLRCLIGDPVTIKCVDAQLGLCPFLNLELTVCPKKVNLWKKELFLASFHNQAQFVQHTFKLSAIHE